MWSDDETHAAFGDAPSVDAEGPCKIDDPEVWMDYYSEELLDLWYGLKERCEALGLAILDAAKFPDFAQFCFQCSSGYPPSV